MRGSPTPFRTTEWRCGTLVCRGVAAPAFDPARPPPTRCAFGLGESLPVVNYFDPDFRFPQDLRTMVALDQRLPGGVVLSGSLMYNIVLNQIFIQNDNLVAEPSVGGEIQGFTEGFGFSNREVFGTATPGQRGRAGTALGGGTALGPVRAGPAGSPTVTTTLPLPPHWSSGRTSARLSGSAPAIRSPAPRTSRTSPPSM